MKKILLLIMFIGFTFLGKSQVLDTSTPNKKIDSNILKFKNEWLSKPYSYGGDSKSGIDCSHLNLKFLKEVFYVTIFGSCKEQWSQFPKVTKSSILPGDLVFFRSNQSPSGWHCGTYIGNGQFIHAANRKEGVKISNLDSGNYKSTFKGAVRVKN